jgi:hypothetical protein
LAQNISSDFESINGRQQLPCRSTRNSNWTANKKSACKPKANLPKEQPKEKPRVIRIPIVSGDEQVHAVDNSDARSDHSSLSMIELLRQKSHSILEEKEQDSHSLRDPVIREAEPSLPDSSHEPEAIRLDNSDARSEKSEKSSLSMIELLQQKSQAVMEAQDSNALETSPEMVEEQDTPEHTMSSALHDKESASMDITKNMESDTRSEKSDGSSMIELLRQKSQVILEAKNSPEEFENETEPKEKDWVFEEA